MIGIESVGIHIPKQRESNADKLELFNINEAFIQEKIGFQQLAKKAEDEEASDLCVKAFLDLQQKNPIALETIDCLCVCTQNGDYQLPQTSAILQHKLQLPTTCAAYDVSLGCSGYVYSLHLLAAFMESHNFKKGLLFTADPYSKIVDEKDKNTNLLFGDAATVTLLSDEPLYSLGKPTYMTAGEKNQALIKREDGYLSMNGREIFNFCLAHVPQLTTACLDKNTLTFKDVDKFLFHQASKYMLDKIISRLGIDADKAPFSSIDFGNTVSSSIPILLSDYMDDQAAQHLLIAGFGVGLSAAASVLYRKD